MQVEGAKQQISSAFNSENWNSLILGETAFWEGLNKYQETVRKRLHRFCHVKPLLEQKYFLFLSPWATGKKSRASFKPLYSW